MAISLTDAIEASLSSLKRKKMQYKTIKNILIISSLLILNGCSSSDSSPSGTDDTNRDYPYLLSTPTVSFEQDVNTQTEYNVLVSLEATGPVGVERIEVTITSDDYQFTDFLDAQLITGTTWEALTTKTLPAGRYHLETIYLFDSPIVSNTVTKTSEYDAFDIEDKVYDIDQGTYDEDPNTPESGLIEFSFGTSNIPIVIFTLP